MDVMALHRQMFDDSPRTFFMHFRADEDAVKSAEDIPAALLSCEHMPRTREGASPDVEKRKKQIHSGDGSHRAAYYLMAGGLPSTFAGADCARACGVTPTMTSRADTIAAAERVAAGIENSTLKISRDRLKLGEGILCRFAGAAVGGRIQAVVDMIVDEGFFGLGDGFLDRMKLLGQVETGAAIIEHRDDPAQVPLGALQPLDDIRMALVDVLRHGSSYPRGGDSS
ncbi:hypothetical protein ABIC02_003789 [Bradyrhizobium sp. RT5a]